MNTVILKCGKGSAMIFGAGGDNGFKLNNDTLFTSGMYNTCRKNGLNTVYGIGGARYDMNSFFMQAGLMQHWTSIKYNNYGLGKETKLGHIALSMVKYIDAGIYSGGSVPDFANNNAKYAIVDWFFGDKYAKWHTSDNGILYVLPEADWIDWENENKNP